MLFLQQVSLDKYF